MKKSTQLPMRYRDFYDVPRAIVVEFEEQLYFLDCKFDNDADKYSQYFDVLKLKNIELDELDGLDWSTLSERGQRIGRIAVDKVRFDESKRKHIDISELQRIIVSQS